MPCSVSNRVLTLSFLMLMSVAHPAAAQISITTGSSGGAIRTGISATTCDAAASGAIRYVSGSPGTIGYCDGVGPSWTTVGTAGVSSFDALSDGIAVYSTTNNLFGGAGVGASATSSIQNTSFGALSMQAALNGAEYNTGFGAYTLGVLTSGDTNTAFGASALSSLSTGSGNTAIGAGALNALVSGTNNVAVGDTSLTLATSNNNVAVGYGALRAVNTGAGNIGIGLNAGQNITSGSNNIIIGTSATAPSATASNQLNIGNTIYGDTSSKRVGINVTAPLSAIHIPDGAYLQAEDNNAGAPPGGDCNADNMRGRISIDTTNNRLYVCNGAARGWDWIALQP